MKLALIDGGSFVMPYNYYLIKSLRADGIDVHYFGSETSFNGEYIDALRNLEGLTITLDKVSSTAGGNKIVRLWRYCELLRKVLCQSNTFDLVVMEFMPAGYFDIVFAWFVRRKLVFLLHNFVPHDYHGPRYGPYAAIMQLAKEVWCVSEYTARKACHAYPESAKKMRVVPHGTTGCAPTALPSKYELPTEFSDVLFWGTVKPYKGVDRLLPAQHHNVRKKVFNSIEIHGRWSNELRDLKAEFLTAGAMINDSFLSPDEVMKLLQRDALFVLPYRSASQSGVLFTLMYHGRYFVTSDVGENGQMLNNLGLNFLLLDNFDLDSIEKKAAWIVKNGEFVCSRMRAATRTLSWGEAPRAARTFAKTWS